MYFEEEGKQYCVFDTVSLVRLCQLELGSRRAIEWLLDDFIIWIPEKIFNDGKHNLSDDDEMALYFTVVQSRVQYEVENFFEEAIQRHIDSLPPDRRSNIDEGERIATAFAIELSRFCGQYIVLVTDDYKAKSLLEVICDLDQIGIVRSAYDLILFLGSRHSFELPKIQIEIALRQLAYLLRDNSPEADKYQAPDELRDKYLTYLDRLSLALPNR